LTCAAKSKVGLFEVALSGSALVSSILAESIGNLLAASLKAV
jgi:hypothetical protein